MRAWAGARCSRRHGDVSAEGSEEGGGGSLGGFRLGVARESAGGALMAGRGGEEDDEDAHDHDEGAPNEAVGVVEAHDRGEWRKAAPTARGRRGTTCRAKETTEIIAFGHVRSARRRCCAASTSARSISPPSGLE